VFLVTGGMIYVALWARQTRLVAALAAVMALIRDGGWSVCGCALP